MNPLLGTTIANRYRVDAPLGRGGMAEVYKVWDEERAVHLAMKVLREDLAQDRIFLRRFQREAQTLANLQHPNIVRFYGIEQDGLLAFMLMDYVEGTTLRAEIFKANGIPFSLEDTLAYIQPVCSALHYAHHQGRVHCDVKPGNIMRKRNGDVLLADFGIARMTDGATATMVGAGTPAYMAPEQVRGEDPTPQTDIYALGVVLYEMLTGGERPFTGEQATISGTTGEKVRWEQTHLNPPDARRFNRGLSAGAATLLQACLAKDPAHRPATVLDVQNRLAGMDAPPVAAPSAAPDEAPTILEPDLPPADVLPLEAEDEAEAPTILEPIEAADLRPPAPAAPPPATPEDEEARLHQLKRSVARLYQERTPGIHPEPPGRKIEIGRLLERVQALVAGGPSDMVPPSAIRWLLSLFTAFLLAALLTYVRASRNYIGAYVFLRNLTASPWTGLILGIGQAFALRMNLRRGALWSAATGAVFLAGALTFRPFYSWLIAGTAIGFAQAFLSRRPLRQVWPWIPASIAALALPELLMNTSNFTVSYSATWIYHCVRLSYCGSGAKLVSLFRLAASLHLTTVIAGLVSLPAVQYLLPDGPVAPLPWKDDPSKNPLQNARTTITAACKRPALRWLLVSALPFTLLFALLIFPIGYGRILAAHVSSFQFLRWVIILLAFSLGVARAYLLRLKLWQGAVLTAGFMTALYLTERVGYSPFPLLLIGAGLGALEAFLLDRTFKTSWRRIPESALLVILITYTIDFLAWGGFETRRMLGSGVFVPVPQRIWLVLPAALQMTLLYAFSDLPSALALMKKGDHEEE